VTKSDLETATFPLPPLQQHIRVPTLRENPSPARAPEEIVMVAQSKPVPIGPWGKATAGAAGAVLANTLVYPLDLYVVEALSLILFVSRSC
jgi:hypothetical protein